MPRHPDIIWILTTQWRGQALGCAGDANARTPHLDALAAQGTVFTQAVTPHPFGPFARAALLSGLPSPANGVCDYFDPLPRSTRMIAHQLGTAGYETAFFGKWHLSRRDLTAALIGEAHARQLVAPEDRGGFMFWEGFESGFLLNDPWLHGSRIPTPRQFSGYQSDVLCERASDFISLKAKVEDRPPFFCVLSLESPHPPYHAPAAGIAAQLPSGISLPANVPLGGECETKARDELSGYYAHIEATDRAIGRLLANKALDDAIVVFSSVHGDMHGAHGLFRKGWPYEESLRVPLIVRMPLDRKSEDGGQKPEDRSQKPEARGQKPEVGGRRSEVGGQRSEGGETIDGGPVFREVELRAGTKSSESVSLMNLHDWTLGWAKGDVDQTVVRHSPLTICSMPSVVRLPLQCDRVWRAVRTAQHKLVLNADGSPWLFFDLEKDPLEMNNLVSSASHEIEIKILSSWLRSKSG